MSDEAKVRPLVSVGAVIMRDGKVLIGERLASHGAHTYQIPGGHFEFGKTFEEQARAEAEEETGLTDLIFKKIICVNNERVHGKHYVCIGFLFESKTGEPGNPEPEKSRNWKWYDLETVPERMFIPSRGVLNALQSGTFFNEVSG